MTTERGEGASLRSEKEISEEEEKNLQHQTGQEGVLIASPAVAVVSGLIYLGLLLDGGSLTTLSRASLSILLQVVMEHLGVRLLMGGQDVHVRGRSITRRGWRIDRATAPKC